ncbi:MAG: alpha/beta hydrolase family protein [Terracidiphilus sp.]
MLRFFALFLFSALFLTESAFAQATQAPSDGKAAQTSTDPSVQAQSPNPAKEDWTNVKVDRSVMPMLIGGMPFGGVYETPNFTRQEVRLQWRAGDPIDIFVVMPRGVEKPHVALYLYSFPSDIDHFRDDSWCLAATQHGLAAVGFISALTGERIRAPRPMREWFIPELQESMAKSTHDVQLIIDYLERRGDLNVDGVGMFGQGSGGAIAILAAAADPRIRAIDLLNPWGDWPDWLKSSPVVPEEQRSTYLTPEFLEKASYVEPITSIPALKDRAFRVQQIMDYPNTPPAARDKIAAAVPSNELVQYKDRAAHAEAWKTSGLSGWLAHQLQPESGKPAESAGK